MFASKVVISDETLKANQLSKRQQGKLRYQKLQELEQSGKLSFASTRNELAVMLGYPDHDATGTSWVNNMVNRGYIRETILGTDRGKIMKEFHLTSKTPDYDFSQARARNKKIRENKPVETKIEQPLARPTRVVIEYCGMTITLDNVSARYVGEIISLIK